MKKFRDSDTREYYNSFSEVYANVWSQQMHTGYFNTKKPLEKACTDMNLFLAGLAKMQRNKVIVSIGCGRGFTEKFLAKKFGAHVIGVDLSEKQLAVAHENALKASVEKQVTFIHASMTSLPLVDNSADYIWVQEALFHCHDHAKAIAEFYRVLKPGGKLILEDNVLNDPTAKNEVMKVFSYRVHINNIYTPAECKRLFRDAGFVLEKERDLTVDLLKTYDAILQYIHKNREKIRAKINKRFWAALDNDFDRPKTSRLVSENKLGCVAFVFHKK